MMKTKFFTITICVACLMLLLGSTAFSFGRAQDEIEGIAVQSNVLVYDATAIGVFGHVISDFFAGADEFTYNVIQVVNNAGDPTGQYDILYRAEKVVVIDGVEYLELMTSERFTIAPAGSGMTLEDAWDIALRIEEPIERIINRERVNYEGVFGGAMEALQYIAYTIDMLYGVVCIVVLLAVDTVKTVWAFVSAAFRILGII